MNYWLVKSEPGTYSWDDLTRDKVTIWDGVRNFQARKNLKLMQKGDLVLFYHSGDEKAVVGLAAVAREQYPDPSDNEWVAVDLTHKKKLKKPVTLAQIKADKRLIDMVLVRSARLSVQPVSKQEYDLIVGLSE